MVGAKNKTMTRTELYKAIDDAVMEISCLEEDELDDNEVLHDIGIDDLDLIEIIMELEVNNDLIIKDHFGHISEYENTLLDFKKWVLNNTSGVTFDTDYLGGVVNVKLD